MSNSKDQGQSILKPKACIPCRTRKIKCNKATPCQGCKQWSLECVYPSPVRRCRRPRRESSKVLEKKTSEEVVDLSNPLVERVKNVEGLITGFESSGTVNGASVNTSSFNFLASASLSQRVDAIEARLSELQAEQTPSLKLQYAGQFDLVPFLPEFHPGIGTLSPLIRAEPLNSINQDLFQLQLEPDQAKTCWSTFKAYLDPVLKIVHKPTAEHIIQKVLDKSSTLDQSETALIFTVYFSAITILSESQIQLHFGTVKSSLLKTYALAAENALLRCELSANQNIVALQAVALFVTLNLKINRSMQEWALMELSSRLSSPLTSRLSPFENEIQNRLAWHIWYLNYRAAKDGGTGSMPPEPSTHPMPLNINDSDLEPSMLLDPISSRGWTDMSFALIRFELARATIQLRGLLTAEQKEELIDQCESKINSRYLNHCINDSPLHWLAHHVTYVHIQEMRYELALQQAVMPARNCWAKTGGEQLLLSALDILDLPRRLKNEAPSAHWTWLLPAFHQFLPLQFLLFELCRRSPKSYVVEYAWKVAESGFSRWAHGNKGSKHHAKLIFLMDKAKVTRLNMISRQSLDMPTLHTAEERSYMSLQRRRVPRLTDVDDETTELDEAQECLLGEKISRIDGIGDSDIGGSLGMVDFVGMPSSSYVDDTLFLTTLDDVCV
jgi:Zn(2)-Cys(6) binuclear cluster domain-containing protein